MSTTSLFLRKSPSRPHQTAPFVLMSHDNFPILSPSGVKEMEKPCQLALHAVQVMEQATLKRWEVSNHWKNILSNKKKKTTSSLHFISLGCAHFPTRKSKLRAFHNFAAKRIPRLHKTLLLEPLCITPLVSGAAPMEATNKDTNICRLQPSSIDQAISSRETS